MVDVVPGKPPAFAVLEPFMADLIAPHVKRPDSPRYTFKILDAVDPNPPATLANADLFLPDSVPDLIYKRKRQNFSRCVKPYCHYGRESRENLMLFKGIVRPGRVKSDFQKG